MDSLRHWQPADAAVLVPVREWQRLHEAARPTLKELLLLRRAGGTFPSCRAAVTAGGYRAH